MVVSLLAPMSLVLAAAASASSGQSPTSVPAVTTYGDALPLGAPNSADLHAPLVGVVATADSQGYWLVSARGGVFTYGDADFYGSDAASRSFGTYVGLAPTADGHGYWIAGASGLVDSFGDALPPDQYPEPHAPIAGIVPDPGTTGLWLVGADGGVFSLDGSGFYGSLGDKQLNARIVAMAATPDGRGYWLAGADGGVFSFGDARFFGSLGGKRLNAPVVGMAPAPDGRGYWLTAADGGVFSFGDAGFHGSMGASPPGPRTPVAAMAATHDGAGYWLATTDRLLPAVGPLPSVVAQCNLSANHPDVEPAVIILACGDGNAYFHGLDWSSWTSSAAMGRGQYVHNTCTPDCADGTFVSTPAIVSLAYPVETGAGPEFASLSYTVSDPSAPSGRRTWTEVIPTSPG